MMQGDEFGTNSHLDEMRQEMMNLMDENIRDSVHPVKQGNISFNIVKNRKGEKILTI
jgi:hypothetical protein